MDQGLTTAVSQGTRANLDTTVLSRATVLFLERCGWTTDAVKLYQRWSTPTISSAFPLVVRA